MAIKLQETTQFRLTIPEPFDFALTVSKPAGWTWSTPTEAFEDGVLWGGTSLGDMPVGLKLTSPVAGHVTATAYTAVELTGAARNGLRDALEFGLGKHLDLKGFYSFARKDDILDKTVRDLYGMRAGRMEVLFGRVILAICLQMAQLNRSRQMMDAILRLYGTRVRFEGREMILWPSPGKMARLEATDLRQKANMGYRADRLSAAARYLDAHPLDIRALDAMPD